MIVNLLTLALSLSTAFSASKAAALRPAGGGIFHSARLDIPTLNVGRICSSKSWPNNIYLELFLENKVVYYYYLLLIVLFRKAVCDWWRLIPGQGGGDQSRYEYSDSGGSQMDPTNSTLNVGGVQRRSPKLAQRALSLLCVLTGSGSPHTVQSQDAESFLFSLTV